MFCLRELYVHTKTRDIGELHKIYFNAKSISPRVMQRDLHDQCIFLRIIPAGETRRKCKSKLLPTRFFQHLLRTMSLPLPRNQSWLGHSDRWQSTGIAKGGILTGKRWAIKLSSLRFTQEKPWNLQSILPANSLFDWQGERKGERGQPTAPGSPGRGTTA